MAAGGAFIRIGLAVIVAGAAACASRAGTSTLVSPGAAGHGEQLPPDSILWSSMRRLTWADFQGRPDAASEAAAITSYVISYEAECEGSRLSARIVSAFLPERSWVRPSLTFRSLEGDRALSHEQTHFDLSEVHVRLMRKRLRDLDDPCKRSPQELSAMVEPFLAQDSEAQSRYDRESTHGLNPEGQAHWDAQVARDLKALAKYAWDFR